MMSSLDHLESHGQAFRHYQDHIAGQKLFLKRTFICRREISFSPNFLSLSTMNLARRKLQILCVMLDLQVSVTERENSLPWSSDFLQSLLFPWDPFKTFSFLNKQVWTSDSNAVCMLPPKFKEAPKMLFHLLVVDGTSCLSHCRALSHVM